MTLDKFNYTLNDVSLDMEIIENSFRIRIIGESFKEDLYFDKDEFNSLKWFINNISNKDKLV